MAFSLLTITSSLFKCSSILSSGSIQNMKNLCVMTLTLGSWPRQGVGWECDSGITFTLLGVWESVREWAHTLSSGFSLWELEFQWISKYLKSNLRGQNSLDREVPYTIEKILRLRCLKWTYMTHLSF
jgi:hypothetical protein